MSLGGLRRNGKGLAGKFRRSENLATFAVMVKFKK